MRITEKAKIEKINLKDKNIIVFEKTQEEEYYKPLNTNAVNYLKKQYKKYRKDKKHDIEHTIVDENERTFQKFQLNLIGKFLDEIKLKDKGLKTINENLLVYLIIDKKLTPLNTIAEEEKEKLKNLIQIEPTYIKEVWLEINPKFEEYLNMKGM